MSPVEETMSRAVLKVRPEDTLEQGAQAMIERRTGSAVVTDGGTLVGIVTERDVLRAVANGRIPWSTKIADVMTHDPVSVPPDTDTSEAIQIMLKGGFRHLPICVEGNLVGLVSLRELLRAQALPLIGSTIAGSGTSLNT
ncbi:MAG TPA: CBS domain-containing protein [Actinomycetota bacterium]|nr:CBS domain-containing protein [Actinomycetota bacterium]